ERDKDELRQMGIPVETGSNDSFFDDEVGYRVRRSDFELPPVDFTAEERMVLGLASQVFAHAALSPQAATAVGKLRAAGIETDPGRLSAVTAAVSTPEPTFLLFWEAVASRTRVRFEYRQPGQSRLVEPWAVLHRKGAWYVAGRDADRDQPRVFKVSRVLSAVTEGQPEAYPRPEPALLQAATESLEPPQTGQRATVAVRGVAAPALRRRGEPCDKPAPEGYRSFEVEYGLVELFAGEVAEAGPDVLVLAPAELQQAVLRRLAGVAARPLSEEVS
ncbi:MAG: WYL domain-containing protein, partial [Actinomycetia bacterium]|nr:WYL domain-containing protein [Actinomycetes bacterium]